MAKVRVLKLNSVTVQVSKPDPAGPKKAVVFAEGQVATTGWTAAELRTTEHELSADGILDLELVAEPPDPAMLVLQVFTNISAQIVWETDVDRLIGAHVYSRSNDILKLVVEPPPVHHFPTTLVVGEEHWPKPLFPEKSPFHIGEKLPMVGHETSPHGMETLAMGEKIAVGETSPAGDDPGPLLQGGDFTNPNPFGRR